MFLISIFTMGNKKTKSMLIIEIIRYLFKFTLISSMQIFSFIYFIIKAETEEKRVLALREGLVSIAYIAGILAICLGKWEIGLIISVLAIAYANYYIHEDSKEFKKEKSTSL